MMYLPKRKDFFTPIMKGLDSNIDEMFSPMLKSFEMPLRDFMSLFNEFDASHIHDNFMKTDIVENDKGFVLSMNLPGYKKEDIKAEVKNGYLEIQAERKEEKEKKDENEKVICKERYTGSCKRNFYIGDKITEADIKASFENGVLKLEIPKVEEEEEQPKLVEIL